MFLVENCTRTQSVEAIFCTFCSELDIINALNEHIYQLNNVTLVNHRDDVYAMQNYAAVNSLQSPTISKQHYQRRSDENVQLNKQVS